MTERKPAHVSFGDWVEGQIRDAQRRGEFDHLPGQGRPLPTGPAHDDLSWIAAKLRRENLPVTAILPPSLALPKEIEELPARIAALKSERQVREVLDELNDRILKAHRRPQEGPPLLVTLQDVDKWLDAWRRASEATAAERAAQREQLRTKPAGPADRRRGAARLLRAPWRGRDRRQAPS